MVVSTMFYEDRKVRQKTVFLDSSFQRDRIIELVFKGYNLVHEPNGFVRLEKFITIPKPRGV